MQINAQTLAHIRLMSKYIYMCICRLWLRYTITRVYNGFKERRYKEVDVLISLL